MPKLNREALAEQLYEWAIQVRLLRGTPRERLYAEATSIAAGMDQVADDLEA